MSRVTTIKELALIALKPQNIFCESKYLFLLSHMRSRSTVLSHIIGSNIDVCNYRELHLSYTSGFSLVRMRAKIFQDLKSDFKGKYLLDKILHDYPISNNFFKMANLKVVILIREPISTFKSIINMGELTKINWYLDPEKILNYYCDQLSRLVQYARSTKGNYFFIESDELIDKSDNVLRDLSIWLGLSQRLEKEYELFSNTGKPGHGDPSTNIKMGVLKKTNDYLNIEIPIHIMKKANEVYKRTKVILESGMVEL